MSQSTRFIFLAFTTIGIFFFACKSLQKNQPVSFTPPVIVKPAARVLVFIKTKGFYHESIPTGAAAMKQLGTTNNFLTDTSSNASIFNNDSLKNYQAVVFLNTTMNVLNADQQVAFERYIQAGGGFMGIHAATDTEYDWPWYNKLVGAQFASHPRNQKAMIRVTDKQHPATKHLPDNWERFDEWYNFKNVQDDLKVLAWLDETTYQGGSMGDKHPFAWYHEFDGGRAFYTAGGHTKESYSDSLFLKHLLGGLRYAMGTGITDQSKAYAVKAPEENRFTKTILSNDLNEPMELIIAPDGRVFFTERAGMFYVYEPAVKRTRLLHQFPAKAVDKYLNGLIGITLDPDFEKNNFIYFFYSSSTGNIYHQNLSRFRITAEGNLDTLSEKVIIKIPIDLEVSAHTGGSLAWDKYNNLYISTGDNTVPFESDGYAPLDERAGRHVYDAQRSAGNPNDLRGKILKIHPEPDGSYTVPPGNLYPAGTPGTKPEIYVMGCRNPYRISVDYETSYVYWGEVGPDAGLDSRHGPRGYDEFNQAKKPGNFGWPYFVGNSKAYNDSDFAAKTIGQLYDPNAPVNISPNNTGVQQLPPATNPLVWYPYNRSDEFPILGDGGRCAMGGPVYHYRQNGAATRLPAYYDKALFVYDWMRNWVFALRLDEQYNYKRLEPFMPATGDFRRPIDIEIAPDGVMYVLEYGSVYGINNEDARLVRIDYNAGNRMPVANISTRDTAGHVPYKATFSGTGSYDYDEEDQLRYEWILDDKVFSATPNASYTFEKNGIYNPVLRITDPSGLTSTDTITVMVGNTAPKVVIRTLDNNTFFFNKPTSLLYRVNVSDKEDTTVDLSKVQVTLKYIPRVASQQSLTGHQQLDENYNLGKSLIALSDCKACHQVNGKSVGPSYFEIANKYKTDKNAPGYLSNKIITGGNGVWGDKAMSAHPQLSKEETTEMVKYILSITDKKESNVLPSQGQVVLNQHLAKPDEGRYLLMASYTDQGGTVVPMSNRNQLMLRPARWQAEDADVMYNLQKNEWRLGSIHHGSYFVFRNVDLRDVSHLTYRYSSLDKSGTLQVRLDAVTGPVVSTFAFQKTGAWSTYTTGSVPVNDPGGLHDLYFVFAKADTPNRDLATIDWVRFEGGWEVKEKSPVAPAKTTRPTSTPKKTASANKTPVVRKPEKVLIATSDCKTCHSITTRIIGPTYTQIAQKYRSTPAVLDNLAEKVIKGGKGVWGEIPMTPHPSMSKAEAKKLVGYILQLRKS